MEGARREDMSDHRVTVGGNEGSAGPLPAFVCASDALFRKQDFAAATKLLEPLCMQGSGIPSHALRSSIARIHLQSGNLPMAEKHFAAVAADSAAEQSLKDMNTGLLASALGDWPRATEVLQGVLERDANNYAVTSYLFPRQ